MGSRQSAFFLLAAFVGVSGAVAGTLEDEFRKHCLQMLVSEADGPRRFASPVDGPASNPDTLLAALLGEPEGPHGAWNRLRPLWFHAVTADVGVAPLPPEDVAFYRRELGKLPTDRTWQRLAKRGEKVALLLTVLLRIEKQLGAKHFQEWKRGVNKPGRMSPEKLEQEKALATAIYESMLAKFVEVACLQGTAWPEESKRPIASLIDRILPDWLELHEFAPTPMTLPVRNRASVPGLAIDAGSFPGLRALVKLGLTPEERETAALKLVFSAEANFVYDAFNSVFRDHEARVSRALLVAPEDMLALGGFAPRTAQNRLLLRSSRLMNHTNALPGQARVGRSAMVPSRAVPLAMANPALAATRTYDQTALVKYFGGNALTGDLSYGLGMNYGRVALLRATAKALAEYETDSAAGSRMAIALGHGALNEAFLLREAIGMAETALAELGDEVGHLAPLLLQDSSAFRLRERMALAPTVSTLAQSLLPPELATGVERRIVIEGPGEGVWTVATTLYTSGALGMHTLAFFPKELGGTKTASFRVRLEPEGLIEILDGKSVVQLPVQGELERPFAELMARIPALGAEKEYRVMDEASRRWAWELLQALDRQLYVGRGYASRVAAQTSQILPLLTAYFSAPSAATLRALREHLETIELPKLDRVTLRSRAASAAPAPRSFRQPVLFADKKADWKALGAEARESARPRYVVDAVIVDAHAENWRARFVDPDHEGFDLRATPREGEGYRAVEVKSVKSTKGFVTLTENELKAALRLGPAWLLAVGVVDADGEVRLEYFDRVFEGLEGLQGLGLHSAPLSLEALRASGKSVANPWARP